MGHTVAGAACMHATPPAMWMHACMHAAPLKEGLGWAGCSAELCCAVCAVKVSVLLQVRSGGHVYKGSSEACAAATCYANPLFMLSCQPALHAQLDQLHFRAQLSTSSPCSAASAGSEAGRSSLPSLSLWVPHPSALPAFQLGSLSARREPLLPPLLAPACPPSHHPPPSLPLPRPRNHGPADHRQEGE